MYPELLNHVRRYVHLGLEEEQLLCSRVELKRLKKKELLLEPGKHCAGNYFIIKGLMRLYVVNDKLNEQILHFGFENWWITDQESLLKHQPSYCYLQAIEPTEVLLLPEKIREELFTQIPKLEKYFRIMMQKSFVATQRRIMFMSNQSDEDRYHDFARSFPEFMQRVPQYMLASYLGFTPQFMSRIRAKKA